LKHVIQPPPFPLSNDFIPRGAAEPWCQAPTPSLSLVIRLFGLCGGFPPMRIEPSLTNAIPLLTLSPDGIMFFLEVFQGPQFLLSFAILFFGPEGRPFCPLRRFPFAFLHFLSSCGSRSPSSHPPSPELDSPPPPPDPHPHWSPHPQPIIGDRFSPTPASSVDQPILLWPALGTTPPSQKLLFPLPRRHPPLSPENRDAASTTPFLERSFPHLHSAPSPRHTIPRARVRSLLAMARNAPRSRSSGGGRCSSPSEAVGRPHLGKGQASGRLTSSSYYVFFFLCTGEE